MTWWEILLILIAAGAVILATASFCYKVGFDEAERAYRTKEELRNKPEPRCTGYRAFEVKNGKATFTYTTFTDCGGLRSSACLDGRCTLHCREMCKCGAIDSVIEKALNTIEHPKKPKGVR